MVLFPFKTNKHNKKTIEYDVFKEESLPMSNYEIEKIYPQTISEEEIEKIICQKIARLIQENGEI